MELAQQVQVESTTVMQMAQLLHQYEMMGNLREQTLIQLRAMFPEVEKMVNQIFEMDRHG